MRSKVQCACGQSFMASLKSAGKRVKCPQCGLPVSVPIADELPKSAAAPKFDDLEADFSDLELPENRRRTSGPPRVSGGKKPAAGKKATKKKTSRPSKIGLGTGAIVGLVVAGVVILATIVTGGIYLTGGRKSGDGQGELTESVVRTGTHRQKEFSSETGSAKTTSEWFDHLKKIRTTDNPNKRVLLKISAQSPEGFLGADPAAFPIVLDALADPHLRDYATVILKKFNQSADKPYLDDLIAGLKHPHRESQIWSVRLLKLYGPSAAETIPQLGEFVQSPDQQLATTAAATLGSLGPAALDTISKALDRAEVRGAAAISAGELGTAAAPLVPKLVAALEADDRPFRAAALKALAGVGPAAEPTLPALEKLLVTESSGSSSNQLALVQAVYVAIGKPSVGALQLLVEKYAANARTAALQTLGQLGTAAAPAMTQLVKHADPEVRLQCVQTMAANPANGALVPALLAALDDEDNRVVMASLQTLTSFGPVANAAAGPLLERVRNVQTFHAALVSKSLAAIAPGAPLTATDMADLLRLGVKGANVSLALFAAQHLQTTTEAPPTVILALEETAALIPTVIQALEDAKASEQQYVVLNFKNNSGYNEEVKWRSITREDIASTPNLAVLSKQETILRYELSGYTFDRESAPDTSGFDTQIGQWKSLQSAISTAVSHVKANPKS